MPWVGGFLSSQLNCGGDSLVSSQPLACNISFVFELSRAPPTSVSLQTSIQGWIPAANLHFGNCPGETIDNNAINQQIHRLSCRLQGHPTKCPVQPICFIQSLLLLRGCCERPHPRLSRGSLPPLPLPLHSGREREWEQPALMIQGTSLDPEIQPRPIPKRFPPLSRHEKDLKRTTTHPNSAIKPASNPSFS